MRMDIVYLDLLLLEWVSQELIPAVPVLYAVSVMDGHSIMLEKLNNVQNDFSHKNTKSTI